MSTLLVVFSTASYIQHNGKQNIAFKEGSSNKFVININFRVRTYSDNNEIFIIYWKKK